MVIIITPIQRVELDVEFRHRLGDEDLVGQSPHGACTLFRTRALKNVGGYLKQWMLKMAWISGINWLIGLSNKYSSTNLLLSSAQKFNE